MNLDRFVATHQALWDRLDLLSRQKVTKMDAAEVRELVTAHQRAATHLSTARTTLRNQALTTQLSQLVGRSQATVYGQRSASWRAVARFFAETLPAALWALRRPILLSTLLFCGTAVAFGTWAATSPQALDAAIPEALQDLYVQSEFVDYYSELPPGQFFTAVGINNIRVALLAFAVGIFGGVFTVGILIQNALLIGLIGGLFHARGLGGVFWAYILPHGLLELTCIFIAGGMGLALGWSWVSPGDRPRAQALREEASRAFVVLFGVIILLVVAALIEGYVTGSTLPVVVKVATGAIVEAAFLLYAILLGSQAAAKGLTGTFRQAERPTWS